MTLETASASEFCVIDGIVEITRLLTDRVLSGFIFPDE